MGALERCGRTEADVVMEDVFVWVWMEVRGLLLVILVIWGRVCEIGKLGGVVVGAMGFRLLWVFLVCSQEGAGLGGGGRKT